MADGPRGLLVDFGGVLTTDVMASLAVFCAEEGIAVERVGLLFRDDPEARAALADVETGRIEPAAFERVLARGLGLDADRLIERMLGASVPDDAMIDAVLTARAGGVRTGLLSNSWGGTLYDRSRWPELFDAVVVSAEVGLRKPDPAIYELAVDRLGVAAGACVFVDDMEPNLPPAREVGLATIHHRDAASTIEQLEALLGVALR